MQIEMLTETQSISATLKELTKDLHTQTEKAMQIHKLLAPDLKKKDYANALSILFIVHYRIWSFINAFSTIPNELKNHQHQKVKWLQEDLASLLFPLQLHEKEKPEQLKHFLSTQVDLFSLGLIYVSEGSAMGGQFILKKLQTNPCLNQVDAFRFYEGDGDKSLKNWQFFKKYLDEQDKDHLDDIILGARTAFNWFIEEAQNRTN